MKTTWFFAGLLISTTAWAQISESQAYNNARCGGSGSQGQIQCGREQVIGRDTRAPLPIQQPVGPTDLKGACEGAINSRESYKAQINPLLCGEGAVSHERNETIVDKKTMDLWSRASKSGTADAQKRMQEIRKQEIKFEGEIEYPTFETWTFISLDGGYDSRCGYENWMTECSISREEVWTEYDMVTDYNNCLERAPDPEPVHVPSPSPSTGTNTGGGGYVGGHAGTSRPAPRTDSYRQDRSPVDRSLPSKPSGKGESYKEIRNSRRSGYKGGAVVPYEYKRRPAGECLRYGKKRQARQETRSMQPYIYSCMKQRARWCTWEVRNSRSRRCENQKTKYTIAYKHDPKWVPGYKDPAAKHRDYSDILPNKFELLQGESENLTVFNNFGESNIMRPTLKLESKFNQYAQPQVVPQTLVCEYKKPTEFTVNINTIGRRLVKAPNPLGKLKDANGNELPAIVADNGKPTQIILEDMGRATQLKAAALSRTFAKPEGAQDAKRDVVHKKGQNIVQNGLVDGGYWHETRFRLQLYEHGRWNRISMLTVPTTFSSNVGQIVGSKMTISLTGEDGIKDTYRAAGPAHWLLGWLWERSGAEFTPGQTYHFKVQALPRGLPFYESGCKNGENACEGEDASEEGYSEPVILNWTAPQDVERSFFKWFKDLQKKFQVM